MERIDDDEHPLRPIIVKLDAAIPKEQAEFFATVCATAQLAKAPPGRKTKASKLSIDADVTQPAGSRVSHPADDTQPAGSRVSHPANEDVTSPAGTACDPYVIPDTPKRPKRIVKAERSPRRGDDVILDPITPSGGSGRSIPVRGAKATTQSRAGTGRGHGRESRRARGSR